MAQIIMYWDRITPLGDPEAGIQILSNQPIDIPANACGFRLGLQGEPWHDPWYFAEYGKPGSTFSSNGIVYSSSFTGTPSPEAIQAIGPVNACDSGAYEFQTPLGVYGIAGDDPVLAGAGSFVATFTDPSDIFWLDHAGAHIEPPDTGPDIEPTELPTEFFDEEAVVQGCVRESLTGTVWCPPDIDILLPDVEFMLPGFGLVSLAQGSAVTLDGGIIPGMTASVGPVINANEMPADGKVTVQCPAELLISATFHKSPSASPATVKYRFRFIHGPVSTVFSRLVDEDEVTVTHSVPIPLPPPIDNTGATGGGGVDVASGTIVVVTRPEEPPFPTPPTPIVPPGLKQFKGVPTNVHRSRVRLEVINSSEGVITSNWARYHIVCVPGQVGRGARASAVTGLQSRLNRWARDQEMAQIVVDGVFGPRTEEAVRTFQRHHRLEPDGQVGPETWERLMEV